MVGGSSARAKLQDWGSHPAQKLHQNPKFYRISLDYFETTYIRARYTSLVILAINPTPKTQIVTKLTQSTIVYLVISFIIVFLH